MATEQRLKEEFEQRVAERTTKLQRENEALRQELSRLRQSEESQQKSQQYEALVQSLDGIVWELDASSFRFLFVSKQAERLLGYPVERWLNEPNFWQDHLHPDDCSWAVKFCVAATARGEDHQFEYRMMAANGRVVWLRDIVTVCVMEDQTVRLRGVMMDITERKRAEEELRESQRRFSDTLINLNMIAMMADINGHITFCNDYLLRLTGWERQEVIGRNWFDMFLPEDEQRRVKTLLEDVPPGGLVSPHFENEIKTRSGERRLVRWTNTTLRDLDRQVIGIAAIGDDITARRQAEQENRKLLHDLGERIKELTALHGAAHILQHTHSDTVQVLHQLAALMPPAFQYPEITVARFRLGDLEAQTPNFAASGSTLRTDFRTTDGQTGSIEVGYTEDRPPETEGPFLSEERALLSTLADMLRTSYDRRQAEFAMRESEERFRAIAETMPAAVFIYNSPQFAYVNPACETLTGYSRDELLRMNVWDAAHPDMRQEARARIEARLQGEVVSPRFDFNLLTKSGERRWAYSTIAGITFQGKPSTLSIVLDMTERKQAEENLLREKQLTEQIMNSLPGVCYVFDEEGHFLRWNENFERVTGYTGEEFARLNPLDLFIGKDREQAQLCLEHVFVDGKSDAEMTLIAKDGTRTPYYFTGRRALLGDKVCDVGMGIDITDRKQAEEKIKATTEQLRALTASLRSAREEEGRRIAREIHDELGSALTSLRWDLESLDKRFSDAREPLSSPGLRQKIATMIGLTDTTIGTVRKIASELRPSVLDDLGLVEAIEWQAQQFQSRTGILCHCDCSLENLTLNQEQTTAVFRIFQEALTNVLRHAQATRVDVSVEQEGDEFVLTIRDNGKGITEDQQAAPRSLGLLGMRERAHLVGGQMRISGEAGKGTVVTVRVPLD
jgi:PAS domain S-box-containing protein